MCSFRPILATWTTTPLFWFYLFLAACLLLLAGFSFVLLGVTIKPLRKWKNTTWRSTAPYRLYIASRMIAVGTELPSVTKVVTRIVPLAAVFWLGRMSVHIEKYAPIPPIHRTLEVIRRNASLRYTVQEIDDVKHRRPIGKTFLFHPCDDEDDPDNPTLWEDGEMLEVWYQIKGPCNELIGAGLGFQAERKWNSQIVDYREPQ